MYKQTRTSLEAIDLFCAQRQCYENNKYSSRTYGQHDMGLFCPKINRQSTTNTWRRWYIPYQKILWSDFACNLSKTYHLKHLSTVRINHINNILKKKSHQGLFFIDLHQILAVANIPIYDSS